VEGCFDFVITCFTIEEGGGGGGKKKKKEETGKRGKETNTLIVVKGIYI